MEFVVISRNTEIIAEALEFVCLAVAVNVSQQGQFRALGNHYLPVV